MVSGWRAWLWLAVALVAGVLLLSALMWLATLLILAAVVVAINLLWLPRVARWLRLPELALAVALLPLLVAGGWLLSGILGAATGVGLWLVCVALPRLALRRLRGQLRTRSRWVGPPREIVADFRQLS